MIRTSKELTANLIFGLFFSTLILLISGLSFFWTPHDVTLLNIEARLLPIGASKFILGTDHFGRDIVSMLMIGARTSIMVATVALLIGSLIGIPLGLLAAINSGTILDDFVMRSNDLIFAFPALVIAILITAVFGPSALNAILAIGIFNIPVFARVTRAAALSILTLDYILYSRVCGKNKIQICIEHILPNILGLIIVQSTIQFSLGILAESGLSYIGLGTQPPIPSWGRMLAESQTMISFAPHLALIPGLTIIITVLSINFLGDGLRDYFDPKLKREVR